MEGPAGGGDDGVDAGVHLRPTQHGLFAQSAGPAHAQGQVHVQVALGPAAGPRRYCSPRHSIPLASCYDKVLQTT